MSQGGALSSTGSGTGPPIETLTGNSGGPVPPDAAFNIDILGNNGVGIDIVGNAGLSTLTVMGIPSSTTQIGVVELATNAEAIAGTNTTKALTSDDLKAKLGTQTTHGVAIGAGTSSALSWTGAGNANQVLTSNGVGLDPTFQSVSAAGAITSITGNTGGPEIPSSGNFNVLGTGSITVAGSANTETIQLTGLTNHNILVGAGTATITNVAPSATSGVPLISQGASSDPAFGTAVVAGGGTGVTSNTAYAVLCGGTTSTNPIQSIASVGTTGQILTSNGAGALPTFQSVGSLVLLASHTASNSASLTFTSLITATYSTYFLTFSKVVPIADSVLELQISTNNGSSYSATGYQAGCNSNVYTSATITNTNSSTALLLSGTIESTQTGCCGHVWLYNLQNGGDFFARGDSHFVNSTPVGVMAYFGGATGDTSVNAFQVLMSTGNINTGTFSLYGLIE